MRVLHYFLGFPPYRTGGLTKYALDLMKEQVHNGDYVFALWPGQMRFINKEVCIKQRKSVAGIINYEIINPLPVPLDEGVVDFDSYMQSCDANIYREFLRKYKPDVMHIHTLMGMHKELICVAEELGIRTVFTTHDYFGLCPKVTFYRYGSVCNDSRDCRDCIRCNKDALSIKKIKILQSPLYRILKNTIVVRALRQRHRDGFFEEEKLLDIPDMDKEYAAEKYRRLRAYYVDMLEKIDVIHFNSSVAEEIYKKYITPKSSKVVTITHKNIRDNRIKNTWHYGKLLKIVSLAPAKPFKGFGILKSALDELWDEGQRNFELHIFSPVPIEAPYMKIQKNGYSYEQLGDILAQADILVAPSIWYETFGFTVLEALSYGVPVIVSNHVGSKDIIGRGGIIVKAGDKEQLKCAILSLTEERQRELRREIQKNVTIKTWEKLVCETYKMYEFDAK